MLVEFVKKLDFMFFKVDKRVKQPVPYTFILFLKNLKRVDIFKILF